MLRRQHGAVSHGWLVSSTLALAGWGASRYTILSARAAGAKASWLPAVLDGKKQRPNVVFNALLEVRVLKMAVQRPLSVAEGDKAQPRHSQLGSVGVAGAAAGNALDGAVLLVVRFGTIPQPWIHAGWRGGTGLQPA